MKSVAVAFLILAVLAGRAGALGEESPDLPIVEGGLSLNHTPPPSCEPYRELDVSVTVECAMLESVRVTVHFRELGDGGFYDRPMEWVGGNLFRSSIPARIVGNNGAEYYITARLGPGMARAGSPQQPFAVATPYRFEGAVPDELPGDDFMRAFSLDEPDTTVAESGNVTESGSELGVQLVVLMVLIAMAFMIYQRIGSKA